jgi:S1-C subfamily serine protease
MPDLLGIHVDPRSAATITHVDEGSEAAQAGLRDGDVVTYMAGQRILSPADIQWALHVAPDEVDIEVRVRRTNDEFATKVSLPPNWRRRGSFSWRWRSNRETLKRMLDGEAWHCEDLAENERTRVGIPRGQLGIKVLGNLRKKDKVLFAGDIITAVDDRDTLDNCSEFFAYIMQDKLPGSTLRLSVLRDGQPLRFELPVVE